MRLGTRALGRPGLALGPGTWDQGPGPSLGRPGPSSALPGPSWASLWALRPDSSGPGPRSLRNQDRHLKKLIQQLKKAMPAAKKTNDSSNYQTKGGHIGPTGSWALSPLGPPPGPFPPRGVPAPPLVPWALDPPWSFPLDPLGCPRALLVPSLFLPWASSFPGSGPLCLGPWAQGSQNLLQQLKKTIEHLNNH